MAGVPGVVNIVPGVPGVVTAPLVPGVTVAFAELVAFAEALAVPTVAPPPCADGAPLLLLVLFTWIGLPRSITQSFNNFTQNVYKSN